ncbi:hypothetical protein [Phenylobacterium sp.]|uniref:hypothetical protein n=1 Tax=Phenylobacterium sp. TaxID=1871053 RepID=UPI0030F441E1
MELVLGFGWFLGSMYALVSLFRPLPPFKGRKQAGLALIGVQIAAVAAAIAIPSPAPVAEAQAPAPPAPADVARADAPSGDPSYLVRIKPGEKLTEAPSARPADLAALREKTRAGLETLDAAEVVLTNAVQNGRVDLVRDAQIAVQKVSFAMVRDREPLRGTGDMERVAPCERAASNLASVARSAATEGQGTTAVQNRLRLMGRYQEERERCAAWLSE